MSKSRDALNDVLDAMRRQRDELALKMHLAKMESKEEFDRLSEKADQLARQFEPYKDAASDTAKGVFAALSLAADEVVRGFKRVKENITHAD